MTCEFEGGKSIVVRPRAVHASIHHWTCTAQAVTRSEFRQTSFLLTKTLKICVLFMACHEFKPTTISRNIAYFRKCSS